MPPSQPTDERAASPPTHADLTVRVDLSRPELGGELIVPGGPTSTFHGWLGLLTALDQALDTLGPPRRETGAA